ncbi:transcription elongation factor GreA [Nocardioides sp. KR10-350]|uniref:transcription elongation factor GreA n=1 Tax=Nocardioides cheoyonin TaxID=3156615 RepID=UPI0032B592C5
MTQSTESSAATIWLSRGALDKLTAELEYLKGPRRQEIVGAISAARDEGDLKENGGYHAAREEQGKLEGEIAKLEQVLTKADSTVPADDGVVAPGKVVTYKFDGDDDDEAETFLLASIEMKPYAGDLDVFSPQAPVGAALTGAKVGDTVEFEGPTGRTIKVQVLKAVPFED